MASTTPVILMSPHLEILTVLAIVTFVVWFADKIIRLMVGYD